MAESSAINKSLSVLGQVVHALNSGAVSARFLTMLSSVTDEHAEPNSIPQLEAYSAPPGRAGRVVSWAAYLQPRTWKQVPARYPQHPQVGPSLL
jgi:hypothetical protein